MTSFQQTDTKLQNRIAIITGAGSGLGRATAFRYAASGAKIVCADLRPDSGAPGPIDEELNRHYGPDTAIFVKCDVREEDEIKDLVRRAVEWSGEVFGRQRRQQINRDGDGGESIVGTTGTSGTDDGDGDGAGSIGGSDVAAGRIDILCNYAGVAAESERSSTSEPVRIHETDVQNYDFTMSINVRGTFLMCKYVIAQMLLGQDPLPANARGDRTRGWIINAASIYGLTTIERIPCYVTSKHAVVGLTKQIAVDYAPDRIHCNAVCPGYVDTPLIAKRNSNADWNAMAKGLHPWGELGTAEDIANAAVFLASDDAAWVTGHTMVIDGGYTCK